jgi:glycosyltransferase involved in cell wall biosynthesis
VAASLIDFLSMDSNNSPRILVVAEFPPGGGGGGGIILKHLLRGQDWNQIYWWSLLGSSGSYQMGGRHQSFGLPRRILPRERFARLKGWISEKFVVPPAARNLRAFIDSVQPDFILAQTNSWAISITSLVMPQVRRHWHVSIHDFPDLVGYNTAPGFRYKKKWMKQLEEVYRGASSRDVISPAMAEDLRQRTGVECSTIFRCSVEPETLSRLPLSPEPPGDDVIRIGYAGTIIAEEAFSRFVAAAKAAGQKMGRKVEIHLFSWQPHPNRQSFDLSIIIERGSRTEEEIYREYQKLTWGLTLMHLDDNDPRYNRFSFPCKFTSALAAGIPLICVGHPASTLADMARRYDLGLLLTDEDAMVDQLTKGLADFSRFDHYRREGARCAEAEFNAERNREAFRQFIRQAQAGA